MSPVPVDFGFVLHAAPDKPDNAASSATRWAEGEVIAPRFDGLRVLVVEDEYLVALLLEEHLRAAGCTIAGPHTSLAAADAAAKGEPIGLAILDVNLNGEMVYPLAEELADRGVPLVFLSGYDVGHFPERFKTTPRVGKPHDRAVLLREIARALDRKQTGGLVDH
jgi:CheY-like chemotaxis protein